MGGVYCLPFSEWIHKDNGHLENKRISFIITFSRSVFRSFSFSWRFFLNEESKYHFNRLTNLPFPLQHFGSLETKVNEQILIKTTTMLSAFRTLKRWSIGFGTATAVTYGTLYYSITDVLLEAMKAQIHSTPSFPRK